ncbi:MAG: hypothetical protein KF819_26880 [Labilithrix sp.]|nr:hypothetical protein [Labilithrix sp.]
MRRGRVTVVVGACAVLAAWACGVDIVGTRPLIAPPDASDDGPGARDAPSDVAFDAFDFDAIAETDAEVDAAVLCGPLCPNGTCIGGVCHVTCTGAVPCAGNPCAAVGPGVRCNVTCQSGMGNPGCPDSFTCNDCDIKCVGPQACGGDVACVGDGCKAQCCSGSQACNGDVTCTGASCAVRCAPANACNGDPSCSGVGCTVGNTCN